MNILQNFVAQALQEDYKSFMKAVEDIDSKNVNYSQYRMYSTENKPEKGRTIKKLWSQHANHEFFKKLIKVHWFNIVDNSKSQNVRWFFYPGNNKHEVSVMGYLPDKTLRSAWGHFGVLLDGRVTFASNDMDKLYTGYLQDEIPDSEQKASGIPRRPANFKKEVVDIYDLVLDQQSYKPEDRKSVV